MLKVVAEILIQNSTVTFYIDNKMGLALNRMNNMFAHNISQLGSYN